MKPPAIHEFADSDALAASLADRVCRQLSDGVAKRGVASLIVSGGRTPERLFAQLAARDPGWSKIHIFLADERWVPPIHHRSNALLLRNHLLKEHAAVAQFQPVHGGQQGPQDAADDLARLIGRCPRPIDVVILGIGEDGHTASLFPDAPEVEAALSHEAPQVLVMTPPSQPESRITLTPNVLTNARLLILHIEGTSKFEVLKRALNEGSEREMPVRAILRNDFVRPNVYWCPK